MFKKEKIVGHDNVVDVSSSIIMQNENIALSIKGSRNQVIFKNKLKVKDLIVEIKGDDNQVFIDDQAIIKGRLLIQGNNCEIRVGKKTKFVSKQTKIAAIESHSKVIIGDNCLFSNCVIRTSDSHSILDLSTGERLNKAANVIIQDEVWLAAGVRVQKGVTIEKGSVVGTASIVTKNVAKNSLAVGIPAKVVKSNICWKGEIV